MPESELLKYWISKFSLGIGLTISFPLTSKPFTIMHKSSIMDFKKCFKEKEIVVYSRKKNKAQTCKVGVNIKKDESGNNISKQMNTWALLSNWSQDDFHNQPLVNVFEFSGVSSWLQLCPSRNHHSSVETLHWFIFARTALSGFQLVLLSSWDAFFIFLFFFFLFHCTFKT